MKKTILTFGGIAGLILGGFIIVMSAFFWNEPGHGGNLFTGYAAMVIALSFIYVGVKNFRDKYNQGIIGFGKALKIGLGITLIASTIYVAAWCVDYFVFIPDFMDKYADHMIKLARESGASQAVMDKKIEGINGMKAMYKNPVFVILFTYVEILPVGIIISLITAAILKRRQSRTTIQAGRTQIINE